MKKACKKMFCVLISLILTVSLITIPAMADEGIKVQLNGVQLTFDVPPQIINSRTMVPMRKIFEALGATVDWDSTTQTITAMTDDTEITMQINKTEMSVNEKTVTLDAPPQIVDGRTLVPVRAVAESFDATVKWDDKTQTVSITKAEQTTSTSGENSSPTSDKSYAYDEFMGYKLLGSANWVIYIPNSYDMVMTKDGNNIFKNTGTSDMMYVQMRDLTGTAQSLEDIVKDTLNDRINTSGNGTTYTIEKNITKERINNVDYYTFTIKGNQIGLKESNYSYCYFTIYNGMLFEFGSTTSSKTMLPEFKGVLESFAPESKTTSK